MDGAPRRIVSLVPSHTESLHDLGLADHVVGRTRFCIHPKPWVESVPVVGGTKDATSQKVLAQEPDLVVADKDENPKALVEELEEAGVEVLWSAIDSVQDAADWLRTLGGRCGVPGAAAAAAARIEAVAARLRHGPPVTVFCPIWHAPWMTFDRTAYPSAMLAAAGLRNVFAGHDGNKYFEVAEEDVAARRPAWILLPTEPFPFQRQKGKVDTSGLGPAGRMGRVRVIDGEALTWFGTRTASGLEELVRVRASLQ